MGRHRQTDGHKQADGHRETESQHELTMGVGREVGGGEGERGD